MAPVPQNNEDEEVEEEEDVENQQRPQQNIPDEDRPYIILRRRSKRIRYRSN
jgi:hypothetical protein